MSSLDDNKVANDSYDEKKVDACNDQSKLNLQPDVNTAFRIQGDWSYPTEWWEFVPYNNEKNHRKVYFKSDLYTIFWNKPFDLQNSQFYKSLFARRQPLYVPNDLFPYIEGIMNMLFPFYRPPRARRQVARGTNSNSSNNRNTSASNDRDDEKSNINNSNVQRRNHGHGANNNGRPVISKRFLLEFDETKDEYQFGSPSSGIKRNLKVVYNDVFYDVQLCGCCETCPGLIDVKQIKKRIKSSLRHVDSSLDENNQQWIVASIQFTKNEETGNDVMEKVFKKVDINKISNFSEWMTGVCNSNKDWTLYLEKSTINTQN